MLLSVLIYSMSARRQEDLPCSTDTSSKKFSKRSCFKKTCRVWTPLYNRSDMHQNS